MTSIAPPPLAIDCFAGAGGLSLGLRQAGFTLLNAFDSSESAVQTYRANLGPHALVADVRKVSSAMLLGNAYRRDHVTLLAGGPPCQGFSAQRRGVDEDARNELVFEFLRLIIAIRPRYFVMENVPGLLGARGQPFIEQFLERAHRARYQVVLEVLDAADYGVPQHRRRAFIVGWRSGETEFLFPPRSHGPTSWLTVRDALRGLPPPEESSGPSIPNHRMGNVSALNRIRIAYVRPGGGRSDIPPHLRLPCHAVSVEVAGHRNVYGRLRWDAPAGTITTKCNSFTRGAFAHPSEDRNITMREAARLQGFPDDFIFLGSTVDAAHQIGNAVPPPLAKAVGEAIMAACSRRAPGRDIPQQLQLLTRTSV
jgi:DNA (cytosine-5)-methyltransferase 1